MLIVDRSIVIIGRRWRSKWWTVKCCGSCRRRKDGSCKHERAVFEAVKGKLRYVKLQASA